MSETLLVLVKKMVVSVTYPMRVCLLNICIIYMHRIDACLIRREACLVTIDIFYFSHSKNSIHEKILLVSKHKKYLCYEKSKSLFFDVMKDDQVFF